MSQQPTESVSDFAHRFLETQHSLENLGSYLYFILKPFIPITEENPQMYKIPAIYCSIYTCISFIKDAET